MIVGAAFLLSASGTTILINCIGLFIKPISEAMSLPRGQVALFYTFASTASMFMSPVMGLLLKRYDLRKVIVLCSLGASATLWGYTLCRELWQFYLVGFLCGIFTCGLTSMMISTIIGRWFAQKRGLALGLAFAGSGLGSIVLNPLTASIIERIGWQAGFTLLAVVLSVINIPVALFLVRSSPAAMGTVPYGQKNLTSGTGSAVVSIHQKEAIRMKGFWFLAAAMFLCGVVGTGVQQHINAYLTDLGHSTAYASLVFSLVMAVLIPGKMFLGWVFDHKGPRWGMSVVCGMYILSMAVFLLAQQQWAAYLFALVFGFAYTVLSIPPSCLTMELMGPGDYSANYGVIVMFLCAGMAVGSPISAFLYDLFGSYRPAWVVYGVLSIVIWLAAFTAVYDFEMRKRCKEEFS